MFVNLFPDDTRPVFRYPLNINKIDELTGQKSGPLIFLSP